MEQISTILSEQIANLRKSNGYTQNTFADMLGVSFQAVSKWENGLCNPDIELLPKIAAIFHITIDSLFGIKQIQQIHSVQSNPSLEYEKEGLQITQLPWENDATYHFVVFQGHTLLQSREELTEMEFTLQGNVENVVCACNITCHSIAQSATAGRDIHVGSINGNTAAGCDIHAATISGGVSAGCDIHCAQISGGANAGCDIHCEGANASISGGASAGCDIHCHEITGDVTCNGDLKVQTIHGRIIP